MSSGISILPMLLVPTSHSYNLITQLVVHDWAYFLEISIYNGI